MDSDIGALTVIFTEFYYWLTVVLMFFIHIGFCMYEVSVSRQKNHLHTLLKNTLLKNTMLIPLVTITFFILWVVDLFCIPPTDRGSPVASWPLRSQNLGVS